MKTSQKWASRNGVFTAYIDNRAVSYWPEHQTTVVAFQPYNGLYPRLEYGQLLETVGCYWPPSPKAWIMFRNHVATGVALADRKGYQLAYDREGYNETPIFNLIIRNSPIDGPVVSLLVPVGGRKIFIPRISDGRVGPIELTRNIEPLTDLIARTIQNLPDRTRQYAAR